MSTRTRIKTKQRARAKVIGMRIDIETKSSTDIKAGAYRYSEDPDFEILVICYSPIRRHPDGRVLMGKVRTLDQSDEAAVEKFARALTDPRFEKHAYNANFERVCLSRWMGLPFDEFLDPVNWRCSAIKANVNGIFGTLDQVARALRSPITKDAEGKALIKFFSQPIPARSKHTCGCVGFHAASAHPDEMKRFEAYCANDVVTEAGVAYLVGPVPRAVQEQYEADQRINDRGVRHFKALSEQAVAQVEIERDRVMEELKAITGVDNPNSVQQLRAWLADQDYAMVSLDKAHREEALADPNIPAIVAEVLTLKGAASLSSVAKHKAALTTRCADGRIRGSLQFYGAHTGREAGRGIQPQNLPRYSASDADRRRLLHGRAGRDAPLIAKGTVRASLVPARGHKFVVVDYNAIEARCLGWQSGEEWVTEEFAGEGKIYEATAAMMFGVDKGSLIADLKACDKCGDDSCMACRTRGKAKVSNLALGYAGGAGALVTMGAEKEGIDIGNYKELNAEWKAALTSLKFHEWQPERHDYPELIRLRDLYRDVSPMTVRFWKLCAKAWDIAATTGKPAQFGPEGRIVMMRDGRHNRLVLPSGRSIWYRNARSFVDPNNPERIDRRIFIGKGSGIAHVRTDTHGGKLTENVTQAIARDVLFDLIMEIERRTAKGWPARLVLHVHDEVVLEVPDAHVDQVLADVKGLMSQSPDWAPGLVLRGEGDIMDRYKK